MGLTKDITGDLQQAFDGDLADAVSVVDFIYTESIYSPITGVVTPTDTIYATRGVIDAVAEDMIDGEAILRNDVVIVILQAELSAIPNVGGHITEGTNSYEIYGITADPAHVQWSLLGRKI